MFVHCVVELRIDVKEENISSRLSDSLELLHIGILSLPCLITYQLQLDNCRLSLFLFNSLGFDEVVLSFFWPNAHAGAFWGDDWQFAI